MIKKKLTRSHETQEKLIKKILQVMFSAGQYQSTEKCDETSLPSIRKYFILKFKFD